MSCKDRCEFFWWAGKEGMSIGLAEKLWTKARRYSTLQMRACNEDVPNLEARRDRMENAIIALCQQAGWPEPVFSGDPRGFCVKVRVPSGSTNDWGNIGICVY